VDEAIVGHAQPGEGVVEVGREVTELHSRLNELLARILRIEEQL
jgi:hypothetical protein